MNRKEALEKFKSEQGAGMEGLVQGFWSRIEEHREAILALIGGAFKEIGRQAAEKEKGYLTYFNFALMRCDLLKGKAMIRLEGMDGAWYLDEAPLTTVFDLTFLFEPFFLKEEELRRAMREYRGKVNRYDVTHLLQEVIFVSNQLITHMLRFALRTIETDEAFADLPKSRCWEIRWGEYKDYSEIAFRVNREEQSPKRWQEMRQDMEQEGEGADESVDGEDNADGEGNGNGEDNAESEGNAEGEGNGSGDSEGDAVGLEEDLGDDTETGASNGIGLAFGYWYDCPLTGGDLSGKALYFTTFEQCTLSEINFNQADLSGVRFIGCRLEGCDFTEAILDRSEWRGCVFDDNRFESASFKQAILGQDGFMPELFTQEQLEEMLLEEMPVADMPVEEELV